MVPCTFSAIFTVTCFRYGSMKLADLTIQLQGNIALLDYLEALYLSCLWGCVKSSTGAIFPGSLTGSMHIFRHFYCSIFKIWARGFGRYDNAIGEISLLAQLEALYRSCLWGCIKSSTGTPFSHSWNRTDAEREKTVRVLGKRELVHSRQSL